MRIKSALVASLLAAVLAVPAAANVQVGSSGWQWGNPLPQGNTLRAMSFAGMTGYAAGDFGTLLKTTDGGTTWSGLPVGTFQSLTIVQAIDAETVVAGGGCVARRSTDGGRSFSPVAFAAVESSCRSALRDMSFVSSERGFLLLADGSVFTTADGGTQFATRTAVPGTPAAGGWAQASAIAFVDATRGLAATTNGSLFQTLDGGVSWKLVGEAGRGINQLWFLDADHGFAVGQHGLFLRSVDGGQTWTPRELTSPPLNYRSIRCATTQLCVLVSELGGTLVRTTDAGETPGTVITPSTDPVFAAAFASPAIVSAAGANGTTVRSGDGGATFASIGGRLAGAYSAIRAGGASRAAYAPGLAGALAKTVDGGASWTRSAVPTTADLRDLSFPTSEVGYALDVDGGVFRTPNGGETWKTLGTGSTRRPWALYAPSPDVALLIGSLGVRRSVDGGETFSQVRSPAVLRAQLFDAAPAGPQAIFAWGRARLVRSTDAGRTWRVVSRPSGAAIAQAAFSSARVGLLRDAGGRVWRTTSAGRRWTLLPGVGTERVLGIAAATAREAYLVIDRFGERSGGYLLRTDDAGTTWQPQLVVDAPIHPYGIAASPDGIDYLLAGEAALLTSTTGGSAGERSTLTLTTKRRRLAGRRAITVTGSLRPASAGAEVVVAALGPRGRRWQQQTVNVASNGTFATRWQVRRGTTTFVAQWAGDFASAGAGSRVMTVEVVRPKRRGRRSPR
jgi:photosystem II stability/assembly factor-like uncharacterized protein